MKKKRLNRPKAIISFLKNLVVGNILVFKDRFIFKTFLFIPYRHVKMMKILICMIKVFKNLNISYFLLSGTLLGSVRQNSFAGRPSDIDFGIMKKESKKIYLYLKKNIKVLNITQGPKIKKHSIWLRINGETIDIMTFKKLKNKFHGKCYSFEKKKEVVIKLSSKCFSSKIKSNLYDYSVYIPREYRYILKKLYGHNWKKPDKKQFYWKKNF